VTRRTLLLMLVGVVLILALLFIVRGRNSSTPAAVATATSTVKAPNPVQVKRTRERAELVSFATAVLPYLTKTAKLMDHTAAKAATAHSVTGQFNVCNYDSGRVDTLQLNVASVQWPPGGTPARLWRHKIFDIYHRYFGAIVECRNAYDTQDAGQSASAVADLAGAAGQMHAQENRARSIVSKQHA
jgi:hypothetical protein